MPPSADGRRQLEGRVAVVTGGTRGIGLAVARRFRDEGAHVVALGRAPAIESEPARAAVDEGIVRMTCDVSDEDDVVEFFASVMEQWGRIELVVNNAGISPGGLIHEASLDDFRAAIEVNLQGAWLCTREAMRHMREAGRGGSIVNIGSIAAKGGNPGQSAYGPSKAGLEALTKVTAREGARYGVRANIVRPGLIRTDMTASMSGRWWEGRLGSIPLGRAGDPDEVAAAVLFLASDEASYVTGAVLDVTGGRDM